MKSGLKSSRTVKIGQQFARFPSNELQQLRDSTNLLGNFVALNERLQDDGYLLLRNFHPKQLIEKSYAKVIEHLIEIENTEKRRILDSESPRNLAVLDKHCGRGCVPNMEGRNDITHSPEVLAVVEGEHVNQFFQSLFGEPARTLDYKWLRAVHNDGYTGVHVDNVYMCRGSSRLLTIWTPLQDTPVEMGTLLVCEKSHRLEGFNSFQSTYGNLDIEAVNLHGSGWFGEDHKEIADKFGGQWATTDFNLGDVLIFTIRTVHMSSTNTTQRARISCDTRWQPVSDSIDGRYMGKMLPKTAAKFGTWVDSGETEEPRTTIESLRDGWGL